MQKQTNAQQFSINYKRRSVKGAVACLIAGRYVRSVSCVHCVTFHCVSCVRFVASRRPTLRALRWMETPPQPVAAVLTVTHPPPLDTGSPRCQSRTAAASWKRRFLHFFRVCIVTFYVHGVRWEGILVQSLLLYQLQCTRLYREVYLMMRISWL